MEVRGVETPVLAKAPVRVERVDGWEESVVFGNCCGFEVSSTGCTITCGVCASTAAANVDPGALAGVQIMVDRSRRPAANFLRCFQRWKARTGLRTESFDDKSIAGLLEEFGCRGWYICQRMIKYLC